MGPSVCPLKARGVWELPATVYVDEVPPLFEFPGGAFVATCPVVATRGVYEVKFPAPNVTTSVDAYYTIVPVLSTSMVPSGTSPGRLYDSALGRCGLAKEVRGELATVGPLA